MQTQPNTRNVIILVVIIAVAFVAYAIMTMPDRRDGAERIGDAIHELPQGLDKATRQLEDRTPAQKLGDKIEDAGESVKEGVQ